MAASRFHIFAFLYPALTGNTWHRCWIEHHVRTFEREGWMYTLPSDLDVGSAFGKSQHKDWTQRGGGRDRLSEEIVRRVREAHRASPVHLFYGILTGGQISPDAIQEIRNMGIPTVLLSCDNLGAFLEIEEIAPHFDCAWFCESEAAEKFKKINAKGLFMPLAADPEFMAPIEGIVEKHEVVFLGALLGLRLRWFGPLLDAGFDVIHYGTQRQSEPALSSLRHVAYNLKRLDFPKARYEMECAYVQYRWGTKAALHCRPGVLDTEVSRVLQEGKIAIGNGEVLAIDAEKKSKYWTHYLKHRDFEAPMAGACYLTSDCRDLHQSYEVGKEVMSYKSTDDLVEQTRRLLRDNALRAKLRVNARKAALSRHTFKHRFEQIFKFLGLAWPAK